MTASGAGSSNPHGPGPSGSALVVLLLSALVLVATSVALPELSAYALGEVSVGAGQTVERELRVHLEAAPATPTGGTVTVRFQAAHGLGEAWTPDVRIELIDPGGGGSGAGEVVSRAAGTRQDVTPDRCRRGCDLTYLVRIQAGPRVPPGALVRFEAEAAFRYGYSTPSPVPGSLTVELDEAVDGRPVAAAWSVLAGLLFLGLGVTLGPRIDRRLGARRRVPAYALGVLGFLAVAHTLLPGLSTLLSPAFPASIAIAPLLVAAFDPWSLGILGVLLVSVVAGIGRWDADGGRLLGSGAVLAVGIGGLWLTATETQAVVLSPLFLGVALALLGGIGGVVIGQAWRTDPRAHRDRGWLVLAVLAHGIVLAGFGVVARDHLLQSFSLDPGLSILAATAIPLLAIALRRWFAGKRAMLILLDLIVAAVGLLGLALYSSLSGLAVGPTRLAIETVGVWIAVAAALGGLVASFSRVAPQPPAPGPPVVSAATQSTS